MTRARDLSKLSNSQVFSVSSDLDVGINSTAPAAKLDVRGDAVITGVLTATSFSGTVDATGLTGTPDITVNNIVAAGATFSGVLTYEDVTNVDSVGVITARSDVSIADKIIHTGDTNTAIRFPAADTFTVETAGSERVRVDSSGNLGIGTDSPSSSLHLLGSAPKISLQHTATGSQGVLRWVDITGTVKSQIASYLNVADSGNIEFCAGGTSTVMEIDSSGRLLLGTTTEGEANADDLTVATSGHTGMTIRSGTSNRGNIYFSDGTSGDAEYRGYVTYDHDGDKLKIGTANFDRLIIDSSGNVAIGTATAGGTLHVENSGELNAFFEGSASTLGARILLKNNNNTANAYNDIEGVDAGGQGTSAIRFINVNDGNNEGALAIRTRPSGGSMAERVRINSSGDLIVDAGGDAEDIQIKSHSANSGHGVVYLRGNASNESSSIQLNNFGHADYHVSAGRAGNGLFSITRTDGGDDGIIIDTSGRLGVGTVSSFNGGILCVGSGQGTNSPSGEYIKIAPNADRIEFLDSSSNTSDTGSISLWNTVYNNRSADIELYHPAANTGGIKFSTHDGTSLGERMSIDNLGNVSMTTVSGGQEALTINRQAADGTLISFEQAGNFEGNISVSGSTVSYNGGHLSRWSQTLTTDEHVGLLKGTVMTNLDEMCQWVLEARDEVLWTEEDTLPEGVSVGDVRFPAQAAGFEDNEQLNKMAVSSVEGDPNVAGVMVNIDDDGDLNVAMTGDMVIRIAQDTTVARGDLLMSAGDGTAKPQGDDIVRSKTIAKVTSTIKSVTYSDGSYCVPCVLMAC